ncbi:MAG: hypothetical protein AB7O59_03090 [Pirellulales bacterium]
MPHPAEDAVVRAARREAALALVMWVVAMTYSVWYCYTRGYGRSPESLTFVLWFPDWVFWGIVVPWLTSAAVSVVFAFGFMGTESLGEAIDSDLPPAADVPAEVPDA